MISVEKGGEQILYYIYGSLLCSHANKMQHTSCTSVMTRTTLNQKAQKKTQSVQMSRWHEKLVCQFSVL